MGLPEGKGGVGVFEPPFLWNTSNWVYSKCFAVLQCAGSTGYNVTWLHQGHFCHLPVTIE